MKKQVLNTSALAAVVCGLAACSPTPGASSEKGWTPQDLLDSHWIDAGPLVGQTPVSLDIGPDGHMSGHAGCNRYIGKVDITGQRVRLVQGGSTRMFCFPQEVMDTEARLIEALDKTRAARQEQGLLLLLDEAGQVVWRFKPRD
jgi:heat shock protein HslJ